MPNSHFQFKQFSINQDQCAMKVTTDGCLFGAWAANLLTPQHAVETHTALDIGTGTGLLSLMLAQQWHGQIDAIEIDQKAAQQAASNFLESPWKDRIQIFNIDIIKFESNQFYDLIISNPPFYENELKSPDARRNTAHHNEHLSLETLLQEIKKRLAPDGKFALLLPYKRHATLQELVGRFDLQLTDLTLVRQSVHHGYFRILLAGRHAGEQREVQITDMAIRDSDNGYTPAFTALLNAYYLNL